MHELSPLIFAVAMCCSSCYGIGSNKDITKAKIGGQLLFDLKRFAIVARCETVTSLILATTDIAESRVAGVWRSLSTGQRPMLVCC